MFEYRANDDESANEIADQICIMRIIIDTVSSRSSILASFYRAQWNNSSGINEMILIIIFDMSLGLGNSLDLEARLSICTPFWQAHWDYTSDINESILRLFGADLGHESGTW